MMMLHASCGDPSSRRSHPISIPIPVISSLCLILRPSLRPFICPSVPPSVRPFVCLHLQSIQIQKTGKFMFTLSHDDGVQSSSSSLSELSKCSHSPTVSQIFSLPFQIGPFSKEGRVCFQKFCQFISCFPITDSPTLHTPVQSEAPHRYLNPTDI